MNKLFALGLVPLASIVAACSGGNANFGDDTADTGTTDDGGGGTDGTTGTDTGTNPPPTGALATGLSVTGMTVLQGVEVNVVKNGAMTTKNAPIVAGRKALVRVFVTPSGSFSPHSITGVLTLHTAGQDHVFTTSFTPKAASTDATFASTFNFNVDAASIGADTTFLVQLKDPNASGSGDASAQFPTTGTAASLGVQTSGVVKIYIFPIHFTSGGGTPSTGTIDISAYQQVIMGMYPATNVQLTVQSPISYSGSIPSADGSVGWNSLLNYMVQKRSADPTPDVYYYGAFAPTSSFASFCGGGCVAGLSTVPSSPSNYSMKASIGLVYGGDSFDQQATGQTMAHEVGHGHGRNHAPTTYNVQGCSQPAGIDTSYPYQYGGIGVWGYNVVTSQAIDPSQYYDIMGYCAYDWISDYTYKALFNWVAADNGADMVVPKTPTTYRMIVDDGNGTLELGDAFPVYGPVEGTPKTVTFDDNGVTRTVTGYYTPYDHIPGGFILAPEPARFSSVRVPTLSKVTLAH